MADPAEDGAALLSQVPPASGGSDQYQSIQDPSPACAYQAPQEIQTSSFQALNARPAAGDDAASTATPLTASVVAPPVSQTVQAPSGTSSAQATTSVPNGVDAHADPATYGTRSRNRTGNSRPNYAEDQEMELDLTSSATTSKKKAADSAPPTGQAVDAKRVQDFARLIASDGNSGRSDSPNTSGRDANAGSKKRKAGAGAFPQHSQTPPSTDSPAPSGARKVVNAASSTVARETNVMTFSKSKACVNKRGELVADDGTRLGLNDHVYLVCEPPGDPYYLCRVMEFLHVNSDDPSSPVDSLRVNWYYRPRDVQRFNSDTRLLYGTMHSDSCPLTSLRGKCTIKHRSEIEDLEAYRKERDSFYFVQVFDRFIRRWYECIPVAQIINVPEKVKKALDERWKFVVVEIGRVKELTSAVKTCKRCSKYCASQDSVDCAICKSSYHMNCVQPPLPKKPSRGFAWACGPCSRASEKKLDERNTPLSGNVTEGEEEEVFGAEDQAVISSDTTRAPSPNGDDMIIDDHPATQAEIALAKMWPMRYLGIHARVEDALQYDDRAIYPRASSRLGPRHQANVNMWHGRSVELVKPAEIKKRYNKSTSKKDTKLTKETLAALEADREEKAKRPKWVQDEPQGYVARGEDYDNKDPRCTAQLLFKIPPAEEKSAPGLDDHSSLLKRETLVDDYMKQARLLARGIGVPPFGTNFLDKCVELLTTNKYNVKASLKQLEKVDRRKDLHEPLMSKADLAKFEEGVTKYGSEHRLVRLHMKTHLPNSDIVRFYYLWKKTPKGKEIWGNFGGRKGSKRQVDNDAGEKLQREIAHDGDDSAFDADKATRRHRGFQCKFCNTIHSRQWRRAPGVSAGQTILTDAKSGNKEKKERLLLALCLRCAGLWRKYAIQWEDIDEVARKVAQGGGRAWKRRVDEELLRELQAANEAASQPAQDAASVAVQSIEMYGEPPKKKSRTDGVALLPEPKKVPKPPPPPKEPTPPPPPIIPAQPTWKVLPCAVCRGPGDTVTCDHCGLTVHRQCFGLAEKDGIRPDGSVQWVCEQCQNDRNPQVSTDYTCCLCLTEETLIDLVEPPKVSHKKKTDREREKERLEKELADGMRADYRSKQLAMNRPLSPREPLKRTTGNNWVHVYCAVWTPEIRFSNAKALEVAEGFQLIPSIRYEAVCKLCKNKDHQNRVREDAGACVSCLQCHANFHASCAFEAGYQFGFDVVPVKSSRKDQVTTATLGEETGAVTAVVWCKEHIVKSIVHPVNEIANQSGKTALQVFVENYKQADLTLTGTVRKANLVQLTKDKGQQAVLAAATNGSRRESAANSIAAAVKRGARTSWTAEGKADVEEGTIEVSDTPADTQSTRHCRKCKIDVTPRWHPVVKEPGTPPISQEPTRPRSPQRRMSITLGEWTELRRPQTAGDGGRPAVDMNGAPSNTSPSNHPQMQDLRFMEPGASVRTWEGMPEHSIARPDTNGEASHSTQSAMPARETTVQETNGDLRPTLSDIPTRERNGVLHDHALPRFQHPDHPEGRSADPSYEREPLSQLDEASQEYLCHKCFLKDKLDPKSPPPATPEPPPPISPPRLFPLQLDWHVPPAPAMQASRSDPFHFPWDELQRVHPPPPRLSRFNSASVLPRGGPIPPPPALNHAPFNEPPHPPPALNHAPFNGQTNSYYPPPPPPPPRVPMHERNGSSGAYYGPPPAGQSYAPHNSAPPRQPLMPGYAPVNQPMPNGTPSPHAGQHSQLQSPPHPAPPPPASHYYHAPNPHITEIPSAQLLIPPFRQPMPYAQRLASCVVPMEPPPPAVNGQPPPHQALQQQPRSQHVSPEVAHARPDSQVGRPTTPPRAGEQTSHITGPAGTNGASASPSLRNLLS